MNKNFTKKIVSLASAVAIMGAVAVPAMAATPVTGTTNVFYSSENIAVSDGMWGVKIPSGVALSNTQTKLTGADYGIALVSTVAGKNLTDIYQTLTVQTTVKSTNGYKLHNTAQEDAKAGMYSYALGGQTFDQNTDAQTVTKNLDLTNHSQDGTFTLTKRSTAKGQYSDTLTFTFTEQTADLKTDGI